MNRITTLLFVLAATTFFCCKSLAQNYVVYTVVGKVFVHTTKGMRQVNLREKLKPASQLTILADSSVELFDETNRLKYILSTPVKNTVAKMIKDKNNETIVLSKRYFEYILKQIQGKNEVVIRTCTDRATVSREKEKSDSTLFVLKSDSVM